MERTLSQKLAAEFVGTATLIFAGAGAAIALTRLTASGATNGGGELVVAALANGLAIGVMVTALGHVSGGHFNPAVTLGMITTLKISVRDGVAYWGAQLAGAAAAAGILRWAFPQQLWSTARLGVPAVQNGVSTGQAVVLEAVLTFFLVWVIFACAVDPEGAFGKVAGLAIGLTITMDVCVGGPFTGAAMNPARWFG
ncbi:MAG: aquaporin, partial [Actinomycetota bacterium]